MEKGREPWLLPQGRESPEVVRDVISCTIALRAVSRMKTSLTDVTSAQQIFNRKDIDKVLDNSNQDFELLHKCRVKSAARSKDRQ